MSAQRRLLRLLHLVRRIHALELKTGLQNLQWQSPERALFHSCVVAFFLPARCTHCCLSIPSRLQCPAPCRQRYAACAPCHAACSKAYRPSRAFRTIASARHQPSIKQTQAACPRVPGKHIRHGTSKNLPQLHIHHLPAKQPPPVHEKVRLACLRRLALHDDAVQPHIAQSPRLSGVAC